MRPRLRLGEALLVLLRCSRSSLPAISRTKPPWNNLAATGGGVYAAIPSRRLPLLSGGRAVRDGSVSRRRGDGRSREVARRATLGRPRRRARRTEGARAQMRPRGTSGRSRKHARRVERQPTCESRSARHSNPWCHAAPTARLAQGRSRALRVEVAYYRYRTFCHLVKAMARIATRLTMA